MTDNERGDAADAEETLAADPEETLPSESAGGVSGPGAPQASEGTRGALPSEIGGYRITGKLGEGGMGIVFAAEQSNPRRNVALKVIRAGALADELHIKLFQREAETLGRLRHPGIAQIYESGVTEEGHHYFAMELVPGDTLDVWHEREGRRASVRQKLAVFQAIADAVQHAHQRGVIHRDLKPANVKVMPVAESGTRDGRPSVKVLDFGLARFVDGAGDGTMLSSPGAIRGTLAYMSPEQARGAVDEIDVRSDVYSLGVILYRMLADRAPYDVDRGSVLTSVKAICEQEPAPMSTGDLRVDRDLELIARKALAKEADQRYATAAALSDDIGRWLADEPIEARPPSTMYQVRKLVKRHKLPVAAAAGALVMIVLFGVGMSFLYAQSERNLRRAVVAEATAQDEATRAREATDFLVDIFQVSDPDQARGNEVTAREILDQGAARVREELAATPDIQADLMGTIGRVYHQIGLEEQAVDMYRQSLEVRREEFGPRSIEAARSLIALGQSMDALGRYDEAEAELREAVAIFEEAPGGIDNPFYGAALVGLASVHTERGGVDEATALYERAIPALRRTRGERSLEVADALNNYATDISDRDPETARAYLEEVLVILEAELPAHHSKFARTYTNLGTVTNYLGDPAGAAEYHEKALAIQETILGPDHPDLAITIGNLAISYAQAGNFERALPRFERVARIFERAHGPESPGYAQSVYNLGYFQYETGDLAAAEVTLRKALVLREKLHGPDHLNVSQPLYFLALIEQRNGDLVPARQKMERVLAIDRGFFGDVSEDVGGDLEALASILRDLGDEPGAAKAEAEALAIQEALRAQRAAKGEEAGENGAD